MTKFSENINRLLVSPSIKNIYIQRHDGDDILEILDHQLNDKNCTYISHREILDLEDKSPLDYIIINKFDELIDSNNHELVVKLKMLLDRLDERNYKLILIAKRSDDSSLRMSITARCVTMVNDRIEMTKESYEQKLKEINDRMEEEINNLNNEYKERNARFTIGDIIKNVTGIIKIENIDYKTNKSDVPTIIYSGVRLKRLHGKLVPVVGGRKGELCDYNNNSVFLVLE